MSLLEVSNLTVSFDTEAGPLTAVDNISFSIKRGEIVGLVGESGSGKSVAAMSLLRLIPKPAGKISSGQVMFDGRNLFALSTKELQSLRGKEISMIFQEPITALSPLHPIGSQLVEALRLHEPIGQKEAWQLSLDWLRRVGIPDPEQRMNELPYQLSGGMCQRVMIAMALILKPKLIIADEPSTALDVTIQAQIFELLLEMKNEDTAILLITHDMGVIWELCSHVMVMYASQIVEEGPVEAIFTDPQHPYTKALLKSIPSLSLEHETLPSIKGQIPSPLDYPEGCHFYERCEFAMSRCSHEAPSLFRIDSDHKAACFLVEFESRSKKMI